jgi:glyoxylase-like metal-dependent hydrolase (beta-lactamase superfamily II)
MKEVYPGIFKIKEKGKIRIIKPPENVYILAGSDGIIYDAGYGNRKTVKYLISQIKKIEASYKAQNKDFNLNRVLPSHWHPDHSSGLKLLREKLGVKITLTKKSHDILKTKKDFRTHFEYQDVQEEIMSIRNRRRRFKDKISRFMWWRFYRRMYGLNFISNPDEIIENKSEISINGEIWKIFPSPGHASDHISLYNEEKGILFSGDNVLRSITTWLGPPECSVEDYIKSLEEIQKLPKLDLILAAHGSPITNPRERVTEILQHRKEREQQVIDLINEKGEDGISPSGIVKALYPNGNIMIDNAARGWVVLTLKMLENKNIVRREVGKKKIRFFPV